MKMSDKFWNHKIKLRQTISNCFLSPHGYSRYFCRKLLLFSFCFIITGHYAISSFRLYMTKNSSKKILFVCSKYLCDLKGTRERLLSLDKGQEILFLCGTNACIDFMKTDSHPLINIQRLKLWDLAKNTPLSIFLTKQEILKINLGKQFIHQVHEISILLALWNYGGLYSESSLPGGFYQFNETEDFSKYVSHRELILNQYATHPRSKLILKAMKKIQSYTMQEIIPNWNLNHVLQRSIRNPFLFIHGKSHINWDQEYMFPYYDTNERYGILSYDLRVRRERKANVGDEIQTFSGLQFIPFHDVFVDRDNWTLFEKINYRGSQGDATVRKPSQIDGPIVTFLNAWYGSPDIVWPPPGIISPFLFSLFIGRDFQTKILTDESIEYLRPQNPIGARDLGTLDFLRKHNIPSYYSGCATLLLRSYSSEENDRKDILLVDVDRRHVGKVVPSFIRRRFSFLEHTLPRNFDRITRYEIADRLLQKYSNAKLVITSRIHVALPCVAMGVPVVFIETKKLPGGGGNRTAGLTELFHTAVFNREKGTFSGLEKFNWRRPDPNPNGDIVQRLRAQMWFKVRKNIALKDTAITFGIVPFPNYASKIENRMGEFFFQIYTTATFCKFNQRSLESIFLLHPSASVVIYSNELEYSELEIFSESGYNIKIEKYSINELLSEIIKAHPSIFRNRVTEFKNNFSHFGMGKVGYGQETDLLRLIFLFLYGGTYVDKDLILMKSVLELTNVVALKDNKKDLVNGEFMKFRKGNEFIKLSLIGYFDTYGNRILATRSQNVHIRVRKNENVRVCDRWSGEELKCEGPMESYDVNLLRYESFHHIELSKISEICISKTSEQIPPKERFNLEEVYGIHLNYDMFSMFEKTLDGTMCRTVLNSRCIFCSETV